MTPTQPKSDPDQLRAVAAWLDGMQDLVGVTSERSIQADLRRIANEYEYLEAELKFWKPEQL